ncbi:MAG: hypothetical protein JNL10_17670 [Verrucomicrobiales bacterium]|nr:hypothetical protein [Verrucomicrobiales bacterium]
MSTVATWSDLRTRLASVRAMAATRPPPPEVFLRRIRFVERGVGLPVKAVVLVFLLIALFFTDWFSALSPMNEDVPTYIRTFFLIYFALNVGGGLILWGMDDVSPKLVVRVTYIMAVLDAAMLALLTMVMGGFDSVLYWVFLGLVVRNAAIIPHADVQVMVNLIVSALYLVAGVLELMAMASAKELIRGTGRGTVTGGVFDESDVPVTESLVLRLLLMVLMTACCAGIQILVDRQRQREWEAREFSIKQQQLEAAGRLAAEIAHQLKNPLGIINNAAFTLQRTVKEGKTITQQISIIREEVNRSDRIITELMGYARLAEGRVEKVNLNEELDRAVELVLPPAAKFDIRVHRDLQPGIPLLLGQRAHFAEVFANLLTNAREAMDGRGEIFLETGTTEDFSVMISVRDTGPGIPPDKISQVFEPYFTTKERGTGLGLAIVKHNTQMYGGSVEVESVLGKGTRFTIRLPARSLMRLRK